MSDVPDPVAHLELSPLVILASCLSGFVGSTRGAALQEFIALDRRVC